MSEIFKSIVAEHNIYTDKEHTHSYIENFYEDNFLPYKDKEITLVEIGVADGESVRLWEHYFTSSKIYCLDIDETKHAFAEYVNKRDNIVYIVGDSYNKDVYELIPECDIFIDDGPHTLESQIQAIEIYLPKVKTGGLFVIEDVQELSHLDILKEKAISIFPGYEYELIDIRESKGRYDDLMFIARVK